MNAKERRRQRNRRYQHSPKGLAARRRWRQSANGLAAKRRQNLIYFRSAKGKAASKRSYLKSALAWLQSPNGVRYKARNNRGLPSNTPNEMMQALKLLETIQKEIRNEHR